MPFFVTLIHSMDVFSSVNQVRTKKRLGGSNGIDFEKSKTHTLIIGTEEGKGSFLSSRSGVRRSLDYSDDITVCRIDITVTDVNDVAPQFVRAPLGNSITVGFNGIISMNKYESYQKRINDIILISQIFLYHRLGMMLELGKELA